VPAPPEFPGQDRQLRWLIFTRHRRLASCRRELLDRTFIWNKRHLTIVLREYEDSCNTYRPHRTLRQAAPLHPLPGSVTDLTISRSSGVTAPGA
jgi:hypothetical protein